MTVSYVFEFDAYANLDPNQRMRLLTIECRSSCNIKCEQGESNQVDLVREKKMVVKVKMS